MGITPTTNQRPANSATSQSELVAAKFPSAATEPAESREFADGSQNPPTVQAGNPAVQTGIQTGTANTARTGSIWSDRSSTGSRWSASPGWSADQFQWTARGIQPRHLIRQQNKNPVHKRAAHLQILSGYSAQVPEGAEKCQ